MNELIEHLRSLERSHEEAKVFLRLLRITRCMDEINTCLYQQKIDPTNMWAAIGGLDWLCELHSLLYEDEM